MNLNGLLLLLLFVGNTQAQHLLCCTVMNTATYFEKPVYRKSRGQLSKLDALAHSHARTQSTDGYGESRRRRTSGELAPQRVSA